MKTNDTREAFWSERPLAELVQYLTAQHHRFVRDELAAIALRLADFCTSTASADPDLMELRSAFARFSEMTLLHLHHEEEDIFPAVEALEKQWDANEPLRVGGLSSSIRLLVDEHEAIVTQLQRMRELRLRIARSSVLSARCHATLDAIAALEMHFQDYIFLENAVLFPRAEAIEQQAVAMVAK